MYHHLADALARDQSKVSQGRGTHEAGHAIPSREVRTARDHPHTRGVGGLSARIPCRLGTELAGICCRALDNWEQFEPTSDAAVEKTWLKLSSLTSCLSNAGRFRCERAHHFSHLFGTVAGGCCHWSAQRICRIAQRGGLDHLGAHLDDRPTTGTEGQLSEEMGDLTPLLEELAARMWGPQSPQQVVAEKDLLSEVDETAVGKLDREGYERENLLGALQLEALDADGGHRSGTGATLLPD